VRTTLPALRAALWSLYALDRTRRQLRRSGIGELRLPTPPRVPDEAIGGVRAVLRRRPASCLERALVLQRWHAAHGRPQDVVIGVARTDGAFLAHAWLDGQPEEGAAFRELTRVAPSG
jgi:hypothetical protein